MNKQKILILGSAGMAGHVIKSYLQSYPLQFEIHDVARSNKYTTPNYLLDVTDFAGVEELINQLQPHCIINCIGILNKTAEENPDLAILINAYLPHFLESITKNTVTKIIHISTDCVFSGKKGAYIETDFKDGIGYYAQTKAIGEINNAKDLTIRTSIIGPELNASGIGLLHWFLLQKSPIKGYSKAYWSGVTTFELAKFIYGVLNSHFEMCGLVHLTNNSKIDKFSLLQIFKTAFNKNDLLIEEYDNYTIDKSLLNTNTSYQIIVPTYKMMIDEMKNYMIEYKNLYNYEL